MDVTERDFQECKAVLQKGSKTFFFSSKILPKEKKKAFWAVYAFCRKTDDIVDEGDEDADSKAKRLYLWKRQLLRALSGKGSSEPVIRAFAKVALQYKIPKAYPLILMKGVSTDLRKQEFRTFRQLRAYCYSVASVVGLMLLHVMGVTSAAAKRKAIALGIAMQLTNILRDVAEDRAVGRIYLPTKDLKRFRLSRSDIRPNLPKSKKEAFRKLIEFECKRAQRYYDQAASGILLLPKGLQVAIATASSLYSSILQKLKRANYDVWASAKLSNRFT
ncbi:MAG: phytoene/squalene synthase family protein [Candidatus Anstonellaceae archaeon]